MSNEKPNKKIHFCQGELEWFPMDDFERRNGGLWHKNTDHYDNGSQINPQKGHRRIAPEPPLPRS